MHRTCRESYLSSVNVDKYRIALCKLRVASHWLNIERGRWNGTPRNEKICRFCNKVENEYHFLFECTIYSTNRETYLSRYYRIRPNMFKTVELFSSDKVKLLRNLAVYVYKAFELRQCLQNM